MEYRRLGNTGISVSRLCFGTLTMGPLQRNLSIAKGVELFDRAFSYGVNFVDTAELYRTYPYVRGALSLKPDLVICTKSYAYDRRTAEDSFKLAVEQLGRDYIDIFLLHEQESEHTIRGHKEALMFLLEMKKKGYIGAVGLSTHYIACMEAALSYPELDVLFPLINNRGVGIADGGEDGTERMLSVIERAHEAGRGIIAMKPLGGGHLIRERAEALDFVLEKSCIDTIAIGMQSLFEVDYNCAVFSGKAPDVSAAEKSMGQSRTLLIQEWCEGCGRCVLRCKNGALSLNSGKATVNMEKCALCGYCAGACPQFFIKVI